MQSVYDVLDSIVNPSLPSLENERMTESNRKQEKTIYMTNGVLPSSG